MNSLLTLLAGVQSSPSATSSSVPAKGLLGEVFQESRKPSGDQSLATFSQVLLAQENFSIEAPRLKTVGRPDVTVGRPDVEERSLPEEALNESEALRDPAPLEALVPSTPTLNELTNIVRPRIQPVLDPSSSRTGGSEPSRIPGLLGAVIPTSSNLNEFTNPVRPLIQPVFDETGARANTSDLKSPPTASQPLLPSSFARATSTQIHLEKFPQTESPLFQTRGASLNAESQPIAKASTSSGKILVPVENVSEPKVVPAQAAQGGGATSVSSVQNREGEGVTRAFIPTVKEVVHGVEQLGGSVPEPETRKNPLLQRLENPLSQLQQVSRHPNLQGKFISTEVSAELLDSTLRNVSSTRSLSGLTAGVNTGADPTTVVVDPLGESGLLGKGERLHTSSETSGRTVGVDVAGGQGLGTGLNNFSQSQSGFQQPSSLFAQAGGLRALEERPTELPTPALQRLQLDVQLSENQRVHIDVGVQNRQVYTGLLMDHSVLRNLATQFVPQLENQLAQADLELQEFSAEVREEQTQHEEHLFDESRFHHHLQGKHSSQSEIGVAEDFVAHAAEQGLHLVA